VRVKIISIGEIGTENDIHTELYQEKLNATSNGDTRLSSLTTLLQEEKGNGDTNILNSTSYTAENNGNRDTYNLNSNGYTQQENEEEKPKELVWNGKRIVAIKLRSKF
jgi:ssDNA-binding replication factor A large subunit